MEMVHMYPFSHVAPYVVGMVIGYIIHRHKNTAAITISKVKNIQSTLDISKSRGPSETLRELYVLRQIRFVESKKIPIKQPNFTNEHVI